MRPLNKRFSREVGTYFICTTYVYNFTSLENLSQRNKTFQPRLKTSNPLLFAFPFVLFLLILHFIPWALLLFLSFLWKVNLCHIFPRFRCFSQDPCSNGMSFFFVRDIDNNFSYVVSFHLIVILSVPLASWIFPALFFRSPISFYLTEKWNFSPRGPRS